MKKMLLLVFLLALLALSFWWIYSQPSAETGHADEETQIGWNEYVVPEFIELPKKEANDVILSREGFQLSYSEQHEQAEWVAYELTYKELQGDEKRSNYFREDQDILTKSAGKSDYRFSGYDRGHLAPAADMKWSETAMEQSFFMSNISPQEPSFNRGIWKKLEEQVRTWAITDSSLYIITGPVLEDSLPTIGENQVSVPKYYYKVVADFRLPEIKAIAFLLPNEKSDKNIFEYVVTIDSLEKVTQLDFFHALPDHLENVLEAHNAWQLWRY